MRLDVGPAVVLEDLISLYRYRLAAGDRNQSPLGVESLSEQAFDELQICLVR